MSDTTEADQSDLADAAEDAPATKADSGDAAPADEPAHAAEGGAGEAGDDQPAADPGEEGGEDSAHAARILNQEEIDSLLGFDAGLGDEQNRGGITAIVNSALVTYERLPMLEVVFDRLVRMMTTSLRNFTSDNVEVSLDNITSIRFGDYLNSIPLPAMLAVFRAVEWDNYGLLTVDSSLIYSVVDVLLGGRRGTAAMRIEGRPYTTIERTLVERMITVVLADMSAAFEPLSPVNFAYERLETNPRFATIARPANAAILVKLRVDMEDRGGRIEMMLPYATLEPVRELLLQMFMGEKFGRDSIWEGHLATELWSTTIELEAVLDEQAMSLRDVMKFDVGDTVMLNCNAESPVRLRCGGVSLLDGHMGRLGSKIAIRVRGSVSDAETEE